MGAAAPLILKPGDVTDLIGFALLACVYVIHRLRTNRQPPGFASGVAHGM